MGEALKVQTAAPENLWKFADLMPLRKNPSLARLVLAAMAMERVKGTEDGHRTAMGGVIDVY